MPITENSLKTLNLHSLSAFDVQLNTRNTRNHLRLGEVHSKEELLRKKKNLHPWSLFYLTYYITKCNSFNWKHLYTDKSIQSLASLIQSFQFSKYWPHLKF